MTTATTRPLRKCEGRTEIQNDICVEGYSNCGGAPHIKSKLPHRKPLSRYPLQINNGNISRYVRSWQTHMSRKELQRYFHALHGNGAQNIVMKLTENPPMLKQADKESFVVWTMEWKSWSKTKGILHVTIDTAEEAGAPRSAAFTNATPEEKSQGLVYLCAGIENADLKDLVASAESGPEGYSLLRAELLQGIPLQPVLARMVKSLTFAPGEMAITEFRLKFRRYVTYMRPPPEDSIMTEIFIDAITRQAGTLLEDCITVTYSLHDGTDFDAWSIHLARIATERLNRRLPSQQEEDAMMQADISHKTQEHGDDRRPRGRRQRHRSQRGNYNRDYGREQEVDHEMDDEEVEKPSLRYTAHYQECIDGGYCKSLPDALEAYRAIPNRKAAEDMAEAIQWFLDHFDQIQTAYSGNADDVDAEGNVDACSNADNAANSNDAQNGSYLDEDNSDAESVGEAGFAAMLSLNAQFEPPPPSPPPSPTPDDDDDNTLRTPPSAITTLSSRGAQRDSHAMTGAHRGCQSGMHSTSDEDAKHKGFEDDNVDWFDEGRSRTASPTLSDDLQNAKQNATIFDAVATLADLCQSCHPPANTESLHNVQPKPSACPIESKGT